MLEIKHCTDLARVNCKEIRPYYAQCHLDFLEMKLRVGLTQHTYPTLGTYVFQGETRYDDIILMLFYYLNNIGMFRNAALKHLRFQFVCIFS